jgi:hypothetical protein
MKNALLGCFYFSYDRKQLFHVVEMVSPGYWMVERYEGGRLTSRKIWPTPKISGFELFESKEAAIAAMEAQGVAR